LSVALLAATPTVDLSKLPKPAAKQGLTFEKDIKPILQESCFKCHTGARPKSRFVVETRDALLKGGRSGDAPLIPGKSSESLLVFYVSDLVEEMEMPPLDKRDEYPKLSQDKVALIRAWIDQGAK